MARVAGLWVRDSVSKKPLIQHNTTNEQRSVLDQINLAAREIGGTASDNSSDAPLKAPEVLLCTHGITSTQKPYGNQTSISYHQSQMSSATNEKAAERELSTESGHGGRVSKSKKEFNCNSRVYPARFYCQIQTIVFT